VAARGENAFFEPERRPYVSVQNKGSERNLTAYAAGRSDLRRSDLTNDKDFYKKIRKKNV